MSDLMRYAAMLEDAAQRPLPPVEKWNPGYSGELDLFIRGDGVWMYEDAPSPARLVRLFFTVLRRRATGFFWSRRSKNWGSGLKMRRLQPCSCAPKGRAKGSC
ncbi:MAG: hypothetical protein R3C40_07835 [Parvularculaceae bacterium]